MYGRNSKGMYIFYNSFFVLFVLLFQGMNYIAAVLLLVTKNEETVFWLLKVLVEQQLPDYYSPTMHGVITDIDVLAELVRYWYLLFISVTLNGL